ncbi:MAG: site-specific DNA-methyltransferase [Sedimentisphaerales bacterium]|nr:site-specific DNA-methyltransferase [Sedimentisphaerales bacterium]
MDRLLDRIHCADCIEWLGRIDEPFADLVFADPPFNIGYQYDLYQDRVHSDAYVAWTREWMAQCIRVLKPHGSFYIAIGDDYAAQVRLIGEELGLTLRNWIIWHYTFGQQTKAKFARAHTHIFYFVHDAKHFTFNDSAVRVPSDRQLIYNDRRADGRGKLPDDVWNQYPRVCGTFKERCGWHPCQMPEILLARIISVSTKPEDIVLDPFVGSGTTAVTAKKLGRRFVGLDISETYVENARKRVSEVDVETASRTEEDLFDSGLRCQEILELQRLYVEIGINAAAILNHPTLLQLYARQFSIRMNNGKEYQPGDLVACLKELTTWVSKKQKVSSHLQSYSSVRL